MKQKYLDSKGYGIWEVTTEGDCEGRSVKRLGRFEGYMDDIALALAPQTYYTLKFKLISPEDIKLPPKVRSSVMISLEYDAGIGGMTGDEQLAFVSKILAERPVTVRRGTYGIEINDGTSPEEIARKTKEAKKAEVLSKLSAEERELLGL